jgi:hypothetical protein
LIDFCGNTLVINKSTKTTFVNHVAGKNPREWKLALEMAKNSNKCFETPQSSGNPSTSQSISTSKGKGNLQKIMLKSRQIINWIINDQLPYAKVKCPKFIKMIHGLDPGITIFREHTVSH